MGKNLAGCGEVTIVQTLDLLDFSRKNAGLANPEIKHFLNCSSADDIME